MNNVDVSLSTIRELFHKQMMEMTKKASRIDSFELQFSDRWI